MLCQMHCHIYGGFIIQLINLGQFFLLYHDGVKRFKRVSKNFESNEMIQNIHVINVIIKLYDLHIFIYT